MLNLYLWLRTRTPNSTIDSSEKDASKFKATEKHLGLRKRTTFVCI